MRHGARATSAVNFNTGLNPTWAQIGLSLHTHPIPRRRRGKKFFLNFECYFHFFVNYKLIVQSFLMVVVCLLRGIMGHF